MLVTAAAAAIAAAVLGRGSAEPPARVHPVTLLGRLVSPVDREWFRLMPVDAIAVVTLPVLTAGAIAAVTWAATLVLPWLGVAAAALVLFSTASPRMLLDAAVVVVSAMVDESDLDTARYELQTLAGRGSSPLSAVDIRSAAIESAAESPAGGLVAPLLTFMPSAIVSLPLTVGAATWVKGVNTPDSMLGHRHKPVGHVPIRLDGAVVWLPAHVSAVLLVVIAGAPAAAARVGELVHHPSSPSSGWSMATLVVLLETWLERPGHYLLDGGLEALDAAMTARGVRLVSRAGLATFTVAGVAAWF